MVARYIMGPRFVMVLSRCTTVTLPKSFAWSRLVHCAVLFLFNVFSFCNVFFFISVFFYYVFSSLLLVVV
jgi:hypothetical protein